MESSTSETRQKASNARGRPLESFRCRCLSQGRPCLQSFARKAQRDEHIENVHGLVPCIHQMCGRGFETREAMMDHMRTESDHCHLVCRVCGAYAAYAPSKVLRHIISSHPEALTEEERAKFLCPLCDQPFGNLYGHYAERHPHLLPESVRARFWCDKCQRYYKNLGEHVKSVHERPFPCPIDGCTYVAGRISDLKKHFLGRHRIDRETTEDMLEGIRQQHAIKTGQTVRREVRPANRLARRQQTEGPPKMTADSAWNVDDFLGPLCQVCIEEIDREEPRYC